VGDQELRDLRPVYLRHEIRRIRMSETTRGRNQDRARVAAGQDYEVRYEANKEGVSKEEVKEAVHEVGNSRKKVEAELEDKS
tara:strand:- start:985 stop:1230 length:246 start_codon:yes stop_codon:yes gene_type:complete